LLPKTKNSVHKEVAKSRNMKILFHPLFI